jgi:magnesium-transporting ATPase (P-type)
MKKMNLRAASKLLLLVVFICMQLNVWSQDSTTTITANKVNDFLSQPWVWVVGGIVLLLILAAIFSGNSKKRTQVTKTTIIKEEKLI